jgi:hypothetical protein
MMDWLHHLLVVKDEGGNEFEREGMEGVKEGTCGSSFCSVCQQYGDKVPAGRGRAFFT